MIDAKARAVLNDLERHDALEREQEVPRRDRDHRRRWPRRQRAESHPRLSAVVVPIGRGELLAARID